MTRRRACGDTHEHVHVAAALDEHGARLGTGSFAADRSGYTQLITWAFGFGTSVTFGVEGSGSYGCGLVSALRRNSIGTVEVLRTDRRDRRLRGKSDTLDAENAARAVLAGLAKAVPQSADGEVEMLRTLKVAKDVAVKARSAALISLRQVLVNAPSELREHLEGLTKMVLIRRCAALRPGRVRVLGAITAALVPELVDAFGIGPDIASELLIVAGDNPERVRSEAAFAKLCGTSPVPVSSGRTSRHRLNRGGHRHANSALYRAVIVRLQYHEPTKAYLDRRTAEGKTKQEIIRCLKRYLAREVWALMRPLRERRQALPETG